ncbi:hypothetical protein EC968_009087 [Mortierella alpina]|nr:hypothetical protein EC968_009087 [Mortierella alpina]
MTRIGAGAVAGAGAGADLSLVTNYPVVIVLAVTPGRRPRAVVDETRGPGLAPDPNPDPDRDRPRVDPASHRIATTTVIAIIVIAVIAGPEAPAGAGAVVVTAIIAAAANPKANVLLVAPDLDPDPDHDRHPQMERVIRTLRDRNQTEIVIGIGSAGSTVVERRIKSKRKSHSSKEYGTHGILTASDMWNKENEFQAWLIEVKGLNPETIPQTKMKEHFLGFMEDYNTVTMPHEKFYNLTQWEDRQRAIRMGEPIPKDNQGTVNLMNDEEQLRMKQRDKRKMNLSTQPQILMSQSQLQELRKVSHERVEADRLRKMGFDAGRKGVRYE